MRDGAGRRGLKAIARTAFWVDLWIARFLARRQGRDAFVLAGACRRSAGCCEAPAIAVSRAVWYLPTLRRVFLWWQRRVNGFEITGQSGSGSRRVFVFRCTHFDRESRSCDSYASRPGICRDYPRALLAQPVPELLPGCGYRLRARNADRLRRELDGQDLTPEQRRRLERDLRLE